ncbi:hypothetical protein I7X12_08105 [Halosimplex litoreum]|uniref:Uncharacterized protein n=1 Tax=Halosimplex litoreum TaxID=1198301 RepID=A0A7U3WAB9_9EURY|nr:hypothetical protein [Halosimplex litoreum]QPV64564.1 hypothetical protein I7X12_08105 [Halosimplex litoreum]
MDETAALRTTIRRCTALLILLLASAFGPLSNYQYDGTPFLAGAVIYLVVSALGRFPGEDPIVEITPDAGTEADPTPNSPTDSEPGSGADPPTDSDGTDREPGT